MGKHSRPLQEALRNSNIHPGLRASIYPRQDLLQGRKELPPPAFGALVGLLLCVSACKNDPLRWGIGVQI